MKEYLTRKETANHLNNLGLPITFGTLQKFATVGGGPKYYIFGNRAVYPISDLDAWVKLRLNAEPVKRHAHA